MAPLLVFLLESKDTAEMGLTIASTCGLAQAVLIRLIPSFKIKFETLKRELLSMATIYLLEFLLIIIVFLCGKIKWLRISNRLISAFRNDTCSICDFMAQTRSRPLFLTSGLFKAFFSIKKSSFFLLT